MGSSWLPINKNFDLNISAGWLPLRIHYILKYYADAACLISRCILINRSGNGTRGTIFNLVVISVTNCNQLSKSHVKFCQNAPNRYNCQKLPIQPRSAGAMQFAVHRYKPRHVSHNESFLHQFLLHLDDAFSKVNSRNRRDEGRLILSLLIDEMWPEVLIFFGGT